MASSKKKIFIIDPDPGFAKKISYFIEQNPDYEITVFKNGQDALKKLKDNPLLITTEFILSDMDAIELLSEIKRTGIDIPVVVISGQPNVAFATGLIRNGAADYFDKNKLDFNELRETLNKLLRQSHSQQVSKSNLLIQKEPEINELNKTIIGSSSSMQKVFKLIKKACKSDVPVSVYGPTGSGKELVAHTIHNFSAFRKGPFVVVNCNAISKELAESELFGHQKGAFTGAAFERIGKFEDANNGTIFLDEIGGLAMSIQAKILRVLEAKEIFRIGGNSVIKLNCRIIVSSSKDLRTEIKRGTFRDDLFYRLLGLSISLPPLRDREEDIMLLSNYFLKKAERKNKLEELTFSEGAENALKKYPWIGNVRELKTIIDRAVLMTEDNIITTKDLEFETLSPTEQFFTQDHTMEEYKYKIFYLFLKKYNNNVDVVSKKLKIGRATAFRMQKKNIFSDNKP